jgi:outer membrane protein OmpA-like peptidoglycan-associated protein
MKTTDSSPRALVRSSTALLSALPLALALAGPAQAHDGDNHDRHFPGARFEPSIDVDGIGNAQWGGVPDHFNWDVGLLLGYEHNPLFNYSEQNGGDPLERRRILVEDRLHGDVLLALSLYNWVQLGLDIPVVLLQSREDAFAPEPDRARALGASGFGDISVYSKLRILRQRDGAIADLAALVPFTIPTGQTTDYYGEEGFTIAPGLALSREWGPVRAAVNLQHRFRAPARVIGVGVGNELVYRGALAYRFDVAPENPTEIGLGFSGYAATDEVFRGNDSPVRNPLEIILDVQHRVWGPLEVFFGGGAGVIAGFGVPDYRAFAGIRLSERGPADYDGDGIVGAADRCPREPETVNGFQDDDGCPDSGDDDGDGIENDKDKCPNEPEDMDGFEDEDGCPEDDDGDGVPDEVDQCPREAEDRDGFQDEDGCPDPDNDGDGILDADDKCPNEPEDMDGFEDEDGCPEEDNDKDGLVDAVDQCPNEAGPRANKGCPDTDRDGDTVVDRLDNCPDEPGPPENGGCAKQQLVVLTEAKLEIKDRVYFKTGRDVIEAKSFPLLDNVAAVLKAHPEIALVRVEGHTDNVGTPEKNQDLSNRRAASVRRYLVDKGGVADARLEAVGYGQDRPIDTNDTEDGKQQNRRVEFVILQGAGGEAGEAAGALSPTSPAP